MQTTEELPIAIECFLLKYGFFESEWAPGSKRNAPVAVIKEKDDRMKSKGWMPSYDGEDPPF